MNRFLNAIVLNCLLVIAALGDSNVGEQSARLDVSLQLEAVIVSRVIDGDTVELSDGRKVRLYGIDAPEKDQPYGSTSSGYLADFLDDTPVELEIVTVDRYGRTVGRLAAGTPRADVQLQMVCGGHAWWYEQYAKRDYALRDCQESAKGRNIGLWGVRNPIDPSDWRAGSRIAEPPVRSEKVQCGQVLRCSQISTCSEARDYLSQCGMTNLDRDGDGVPCEMLCR